MNDEKYSYVNQLDHRLLPGFERMMIPVKEKAIRTLIAGSGPPLFMLHGDPQTHLCWHKIAPQLTDKFTIVLTDIRGRGETHKPGPSHDHRSYSKREMAAEQVDVMRHPGFERFSLIGHDRGARVVRRMALDYPRTVERLVVMDIAPALDFYETANAAIAQDYYYFFFRTQPAPIPERLIGGDPRGFMREILMGLTKKDDLPFDSGALEAYLQASTTSEAITAMCECFRAGLSCDCEDDRDDRVVDRKIQCPTLVLCGEMGVVGRHFDMREVWQRWALSASFAPMPCGRFIPEEEPEIARNVILDFLANS